MLSLREQNERFHAINRDWVATGRPMRTEDDVVRLFETHCKPCEHFSNHRCGQCFMVVSTIRQPMNLLSRATAGCPADPSRFDADVESAEPEPEPAHGTPGMTVADLLTNYEAAAQRWRKAGKPVRPKAEIHRLLEICKTCDHYKKGVIVNYCDKCGCCTNSSQYGWVNKLAMATEQCPLTPPKWTRYEPTE